MTRALEREVFNTVWETVEPLIPPHPCTHPLGTHRRRVDDRLCMRGLFIRLVTGSSWVDIEAILDWEVSDTTLRARRDEWIEAGVFNQLEAHAQHAYDRILELDLGDVAIDGSLHKAPCGGEGTGKSPVDRGKLGWKWSLAVDAAGIPIGWAIDGANRNDIKMLEPTLDAIDVHGLLVDIDTLHPQGRITRRLVREGNCIGVEHCLGFAPWRDDALADSGGCEEVAALDELPTDPTAEHSTERPGKPIRHPSPRVHYTERAHLARALDRVEQTDRSAPILNHHHKGLIELQVIDPGSNQAGLPCINKTSTPSP